MSGNAADGPGDRPGHPPTIARDLLAGLFLVAVAAGAFVFTADLSLGEGTGIGLALARKTRDVLLCCVQ